MSKTVYFLGAGATKAVCKDAPLNHDLVRKALEDFPNDIQTEKIASFINHLSKNRPDFPRDNQIWNLLDYILQQGKSASYDYNLEKIAELRAGLINLVIKEFEKTLRDAETQILGNFIEKIKNDNVTIISTNYDILIDNALANKSYNYGAKMRKAISGVRIDGESGLRRPDARGYPGGVWLNQGRIPLLKLHGSLNWLYCPKCNEVDVTIGEKGAIELAEADCYCYNRNCTSKYIPLLITPTMYKSYDNRVIKETWDCAERELRDADNVVFIGYGLKEEDYEIRCLLMKALLNKKELYNNITVVEMEPSTSEEKERINAIKKKYINLYGEQIDFKEIGFKKYVG